MFGHVISTGSGCSGPADEMRRRGCQLFPVLLVARAKCCRSSFSCEMDPRRLHSRGASFFFFTSFVLQRRELTSRAGDAAFVPPLVRGPRPTRQATFLQCYRSAKSLCRPCGVARVGAGFSLLSSLLYHPKFFSPAPCGTAAIVRRQPLFEFRFFSRQPCAPAIATAAPGSPLAAVAARLSRRRCTALRFDGLLFG